MSDLTPADRGPFYLAVTATLSPHGEVGYRMLRMERAGDRLLSENIGLATPSCGHRVCRLANLGAAAVDWAYMLQLDTTIDSFHPEQLGLEVASE